MQFEAYVIFVKSGRLFFENDVVRTNILKNLSLHKYYFENAFVRTNFFQNTVGCLCKLYYVTTIRLLTKRTDKKKMTKKMTKKQQQQQPQQEREKITLESMIWSWRERKVKKMEFAQQHGRCKWYLFVGSMLLLLLILLLLHEWNKKTFNGRRHNDKYVYVLMGVFLYSIRIQFFSQK